MTALTWKAANGMKISVSAEEYCGKARAIARINGKRELGEISPPRKGTPAQIVAMIGRVGLTADRLDALNAAVQALQADLDAAKGRPALALIQERAELVNRLNQIRSGAVAATRREIEEISRNGFAAHKARDTSAKEAEAVAKLAAFDTAHPEVSAHLKAERGAATAEFLAHD